MTEVLISTPHHQLKSYVATPEGEGPWPGVVVLHDIFGLTDVARKHADWLAGKGYLAVTPDLFSWGNSLRCIRALMMDLSAGKGASFEDVDAVREWMKARPDCTGKTGVIGFCATGRFAIMLASGHDFSVASANYGPIPNDIDAILKGACPMIGSYGGRDGTLKGAAVKLNDALVHNDIAHDVLEYPNAGHSFMDDHKGLVGVLAVVFGATYKEKEAEDAQRRIEAFFARYLA